MNGKELYIEAPLYEDLLTLAKSRFSNEWRSLREQQQAIQAVIDRLYLGRRVYLGSDRTFEMFVGRMPDNSSMALRETVGVLYVKNGVMHHEAIPVLALSLA